MKLSILEPPLPFVAYITEKSPILLFTLETLGISRTAFKEKFAASFHHLPWDQYDLRKRQLAQLSQYGFSLKQEKALAKRFYLGEEALLPELCQRASLLTPTQKQEITQLQPYRRRAVGNCRLIFNENNGWQVNLLAPEVFKQPVDDDNFLSYPREFAVMDSAILTDPDFQQFLLGIAHLVTDLAAPVKSLKVVIFPFFP